MTEHAGADFIIMYQGLSLNSHVLKDIIELSIGLYMVEIFLVMTNLRPAASYKKSSM